MLETIGLGLISVSAAIYLFLMLLGTFVMLTKDETKILFPLSLIRFIFALGVYLVFLSYCW